MNNINRDQEELSNKLKTYIKIIFEEYKNIIPKEIKTYLSMVDSINLIKIENTNTISLFVSNGLIYLPENAYKILEAMEKIPGFGINPNHKTHNKSNMIINDNTFLDYIKHVFLKGLKPIDYFLEILLHETMHLCGSDGGIGLKEGFTELKTRQLALKYNLETSCCAYPKEVKIAHELEMILGKEICDQLTFMIDERDIYYLIHDQVGTKEADLYLNISRTMEKEFQAYIKQKFDGLTGPLKKAMEYSKIDYTKVEELFKNYYQSLKIERIKRR